MGVKKYLKSLGLSLFLMSSFLFARSQETFKFSYPKPTEIKKITNDFAKFFGKTILPPSRFSGKVRVLTPKKVSSELAYEIYGSALRTLGYSLVRVGDIWQIVQEKKSTDYAPLVGQLDPYHESEDVLIHPIELDSLSPKDALRYLSSVLGSKGAYEIGNNILLLSGSYSVVRKASLIIKDLDQSKRKKGSLQFIPLLHTQAESVYKTLKSLSTARKSFFKEGLLLRPDHPDKIFLYGTALFHEEVRRIVKSLDIPSERKVGKQFFPRQIDFSEAKKVAAVLKDLKNSKKRSKFSKEKDQDKDYEIAVYEDRNELVIFSDEKTFDDVLPLIKDLDKRRAKIFYEVTILEVGETFRFIFDPSSLVGSTFASDDFAVVGGWRSEKVIPLAKQPRGDEYSSDEISTKIGSVSDNLVLGVLGAESLQIDGFSGVSPGGLISLMKADEGSKVVSSPMLMSTEGEEALFVVGETYPYVEEKRSTGKSAVVRKQVKKESSEISLKLKGDLNSESSITLDLDLGVKSILGFSKEGVPSLGTRKVKQKVSFKPGQTVFLSGFKVIEETQSEEKVPILGDIPLLSLFFRYQKKIESESRVLIFITSHVIWGDEDLKALNKRKLKERLSDIKILSKKKLF